MHEAAGSLIVSRPDEPPIQHVVQGAYQFDWIRKNFDKGTRGSNPQRSTFQAVPTRASLGHTIGAQQHIKVKYDLTHFPYLL